MVLRNSGRVGSRRFFLIELIEKQKGSGSSKRTGPFVILEGGVKQKNRTLCGFRGYALPTIPSGNEVHKDFIYSNMEETLVIHIAFICSDTAFGFMHFGALCFSFGGYSRASSVRYA